jgi:DNA-binding SARP family transcriptional activator
MRFAILGPIVIEHAGMQASIARSQRRGLLGYLLMGHDQLLPVESVIEALWGGAEPATARQQVQAAVHCIRVQLRQLGVADNVLVSHASAYLIRVSEGQLDLADFAAHVSLAGEAVRAGRFAAAAHDLQAGLSLWRGIALADASGAYVESARASLEDRRLTATEDLLDVLLALGRHHEVLAQLGPLLTAYPLRERFRGQQMLALYRAGRQTEALDAYRAARCLLRDEQGLDPGMALQALERAILGSDPSLDQPTSASLGPPTGAVVVGPAVPSQLPSAEPVFVGRTIELSHLDALLPLPATDSCAPVLIGAVSGEGGVGKTAVAVKWAHRVSAQFPDGQLYINLHGYSGSPQVRPLAALTQLLHSLGVASEEIPVDIQAAASLYRSRLAGKRVLILIDNARHPDQVRPLLPGSGGCLAIVTSRDRMTGLIVRDGATRLTLGGLAPTEAVDLIGRIIGEGRVRAEPCAAATLARMCSHLPLALRIVAATLCDHKHCTLAEHVRLLEQHRLSGLEVANDPDSSVRNAVRHTYDALNPDARRTFRLLSLVPGPDFTPAAVGALAEVGVVEANQRLDLLVACHLVEERCAGRFACHDLLRWYAQERVEQEEDEPSRMGALGRLYAFYLSSVDAAARLLYPQVVRLPVEPTPTVSTRTASAPTLSMVSFGDDAAALAWLDAELANLVTAIRHAGEHGPSEAAWRLADALRGFFWIRRRMADWLETAEAGLRAATGHDEPHAHAALHLSLGVAHRSLTHYRRSVDEFEAALECSRRAGWTEAEATALGSLAIAHAELCEHDLAVCRLTEALALNRRIGRRAGEAVVLGNSGSIRGMAGELRQAGADMTEALAIYRETGSPGGEAIMVTNLGLNYFKLGQLTQAEQHLVHATALAERIGDCYGQTLAHCGLGEVYLELGQHPVAAKHLAQALRLSRQGSDRKSEATVLVAVAELSRARGELRAALHGFSTAIRVSREAANGFAEIQALVGASSCLTSLNRPRTAADYAQAACSAAVERGYRMLEGQALTAAATAAATAGDSAGTHELAERALPLHRGTGHRMGEARTLAVIGWAYAADARPDLAATCWTQALKIMTEVGSAEAAGLTALLGFHPGGVDSGVGRLAWSGPGGITSGAPRTALAISNAEPTSPVSAPDRSSPQRT